MKIEKTYSTENILNHIAGSCDVTKDKAGIMMTELNNLIKAHIKAGIEFSWHNVGKFKVVDKPATKERQGRNPSTGEPMTIAAKPAHKAIKFKVAKALNDLVVD